MLGAHLLSSSSMKLLKFEKRPDLLEKAAMDCEPTHCQAAGSPAQAKAGMEATSKGPWRQQR